VQPAKRKWIYDGFAHPVGRALARPSTPRDPAFKRAVAVLGCSRVLDGFLPPFFQLARDASSPVRVSEKPQRLRDWALGSDIAWSPTCMVVVADLADPVAARRIAAQVPAGVLLVWACQSQPEEPAFLPPVVVSLGDSDGAYAQAAWAARVWSEV